MKPIAPPDSHYLSAAQGWLGLGNWREAVAEFQMLSTEAREHPDALETAQGIFAAAGKWDMAAETGVALLKMKPDAPETWITLAYAVRRKEGGGLDAAKRILTQAQVQFPKEPIIAYNLACYECQLGNQSEALDWLRRAQAHGPAVKIRNMALDDRDLEPLWAKIRAQ